MKQEKDKPGMRYGRWTLLEEVKTGKPSTHWLCRCDCGIEKVVCQNDLRNNRSQSCGCLRNEMTRKRNVKRELGKRYGHLLVVSKSNKVVNHCIHWVCKCDCGATTVVAGQDLRSGQTKSCGCVTGKGHRANNFYQILRDWKRMANTRGYDWTLSEKEAKDLSQGDCFYCGMQPAQTKNRSGKGEPFLYNGIDRVDNTLGYTSANVVSCCGHCNRAKRDHSQSEFRDWVKRVHNHWASKSNG